MAYNTVTYAADMITLLAKLGVEQVDWLGTSMGVNRHDAGQPAQIAHSPVDSG